MVSNGRKGTHPGADKKLETERIYALSITPEGICTVREDNRFRRVGFLCSFPRRRIRVIEEELNKDGIRTNMSGKYLWMSWGKGKAQMIHCKPISRIYYNAGNGYTVALLCDDR